MRQGFFWCCRRKSAGQSAEHRRMVPPRILTLCQAPGLEVRLPRQFQPCQEFTIDAIYYSAQGLDANALQWPRGSLPQRAKVTPCALGHIGDGLPFGEDPRGSIRLIHQSAQLAEAPPQRAAWVVRDLPEHGAEFFA